MWNYIHVGLCICTLFHETNLDVLFCFTNIPPLYAKLFIDISAIFYSQNCYYKKF